MVSDCFPIIAEKAEVENDFRWVSQNLVPGKVNRMEQNREISLLKLNHSSGSTLRQKL